MLAFLSQFLSCVQSSLNSLKCRSSVPLIHLLLLQEESLPLLNVLYQMKSKSFSDMCNKSVNFRRKHKCRSIMHKAVLDVGVIL